MNGLPETNEVIPYIYLAYLGIIQSRQLELSFQLEAIEELIGDHIEPLIPKYAK